MEIFVDDLKHKLVPVELLFNTKYRDGNAKTTTFHTRKKVTIKKDGATIEGSCNGIPVTCNMGQDLDITAEQPLEVNEIWNDCKYKKVVKDIDEIARITSEVAEGLGNSEATYGYSQMQGIDVTGIVEPMTEAYQEIGEAVKTIVRQGYSKKDIIVALDEEFAMDLQLADLSCCDYSVRTSDAKDVLSKKLGVKMTMEVPRDTLSGNFDEAVLDDTTTIKFRVYVKEITYLLDYCKDEVEIRDPKGNYVGATQAIGSYYLGAGQLDVNSEAHAYYAMGTGTLATMDLSKLDENEKVKLAYKIGLELNKQEKDKDGNIGTVAKTKEEIAKELDKKQKEAVKEMKENFKTKMKGFKE